MTLSPKLAALAALPELAHHHKSAEKYQEDDTYSHPEYARVIDAGTFTLMQRPEWGHPELGERDERLVSITGVAVIGGRGHGYAVHNTDSNRKLFPQGVLTGERWADITIITENTLRGWRDAAPYRIAKKARDDRAEKHTEYLRKREAAERDEYERAEQVAVALTASLGVRVTASRSSYGYGPTCLTLSLPDAERIAARRLLAELPR